MTETNTMDSSQPFIPASKKLPEMTVKGVLLAIGLTVILSAANAYLGLKIGMTVSASIPAAVMAMGLLRMFKQWNVLEINMVQTAASSGEALAAGMVFTMPALLMIQYWTHFDYLTTFLVAVLGGTLGMLFSVPLRRILLLDNNLHFPEGTAIGEVLKISAGERDIGLKDMVLAGGLGALIDFCQIGLKCLASDVQVWFGSGKYLFGFGVGFSPALIGAGYIMGVGTAFSLLVGLIAGWVVAIPIVAAALGVSEVESATTAAMQIWDQHIRYIGLGIMIVGGVWVVAILLKPMFYGILASWKSLQQVMRRERLVISRIEYDLPINIVFIGIISVLIPIYIMFFMVTINSGFGLTVMQKALMSNVSLLFVLLGGLVFAAVCSYFAGLVGSSASPISSMVLVALILVSGIFVLLLKGDWDIEVSSQQIKSASGFAIIVTATIAAVAVISNDTMQDLKAGYIIGATPWKQQIMLLVGVIVGALLIPLLLQLLLDAYGMVGVNSDLISDFDQSQMLSAPQASLIATVTVGMFSGHVNWQMILVGMIVAIIVLIVDKWLRHYGKRLPVLAVGMGIYLPITITTALIIGGFLAYFVEAGVAKRLVDRDNIAELNTDARHTGLLLASGLVAGAAIMGVLIAIPFVIADSSEILRIVPVHLEFLTQILAALAIMWLLYWFRSRVFAAIRAD